MPEARLTSKGRVTIPVEIRESMGLSTGDRVVFTRLADGTTVLRNKNRSILELRGLLKLAAKNQRKISVDEMRIGRR
jgi:antitoxin PrlF